MRPDLPLDPAAAPAHGPGGAFEVRLREVLRSEVEFIELIGEDLVAAGGKRVRPQVTLLAAELLGQGGPDAVTLAVCAELLHSASLLHDDLIDAVDWAVKRGVTRKDKVAIGGGSYGGYATLAGVTMTPDAFACGVDIVGPSNLNTLLATIPRPHIPRQ